MFSINTYLYFQPLDYPNTSADSFLSSLNKKSFQINESDILKYSDALKGVGKKLYVKIIDPYADSSIKGFSKNDTISYFKCSITITMDFFDKDYFSVSDIGYSFLLNDSIYHYGNFSIRNQLHEIKPDNFKILKEIYQAYLAKGLSMPFWLKNQFFQRKAAYIEK